MAGDGMNGRAWLTAKGYRALGYQLPDDVDDHQVVVLITESHRASSTPARQRWWKRRTA